MDSPIIGTHLDLIMSAALLLTKPVPPLASLHVVASAWERNDEAWLRLGEK